MQLPENDGTERLQPSLESAGKTVIAWAHEPALIAEVTSDGLDSLPVPVHPWGGRWIGPAIPMDGDRVAIAPISNRRKWVPSPDPWIDAPLFFVLGRDETVIEGGRMENAGGKYLTWLTHRTVLGARADTVFTLSLSDAQLDAWLIKGGATTRQPLRSLKLPLYFRAPAPREQIRSRPALSDGGDIFVHWEVSHVVTAAFGGDRLYAIRNYDAEWVDGLRNSFDPNALWRPTEQGLEIYDLEGTVLERLALPEDGGSWIRADAHGRIFIGVPDGILVARDPTSSMTCPPLPSSIDLVFEDLPPSDESS